MDVCLKQDVIHLLSRVTDVDLRLVELTDIVIQVFLQQIDYRIACNKLVGFKNDQQIFDIAVSSLER